MRNIIIIIAILVLVIGAIFYITMQKNTDVLVVDVTLAPPPDNDISRIISQVNASLSYTKRMEVPDDTPLMSPGITVLVLQEKQEMSGWYSVRIPDAKKNLFSWDEIPGSYDEKVKEFLKQKFGIDWVKTAKIEKIDNGNTVRLFNEKNYLTLTLNEKKTGINIKIDDGRTDELTAKNEAGKLNIYDYKGIYGTYTITLKLSGKLDLEKPVRILTRVLDPAGNEVSVKVTTVKLS